VEAWEIGMLSFLWICQGLFSIVETSKWFHGWVTLDSCWVMQSLFSLACDCVSHQISLPLVLHLYYLSLWLSFKHGFKYWPSSTYIDNIVRGIRYNTSPINWWISRPTDINEQYWRYWYSKPLANTQNYTMLSTFPLKHFPPIKYKYRIS